MMSFAPPLPGQSRPRVFMLPITLLWMFPYIVDLAAPMNPVV